jgi:hypothetical protein
VTTWTPSPSISKWISSSSSVLFAALIAERSEPGPLLATILTVCTGGGSWADAAGR